VIKKDLKRTAQRKRTKDVQPIVPTRPKEPMGSSSSMPEWGRLSEVKDLNGISPIRPEDAVFKVRKKQMSGSGNEGLLKGNLTVFSENHNKGKQTEEAEEKKKK